MASLNLSGSGQVVFVRHGATRGGAAAVAAFLSWLGCGLGELCLGLPGLGPWCLYFCLLVIAGHFGSCVIFVSL